MSNYSGDLTKLFEFYAKDIAKEDGTVEENASHVFQYKYDLHDSTTTLAYPYSSSGNAGVVFTTALKNTDDSDYGFVSFDAHVIKVGEDKYMRETIIFTDNGSNYLKASGFFQESGSSGFSSPGYAIFYAESASSSFAKIKRVKVVFNHDRTRDVYFYTTIKGELKDPSS